MESTNQTEAGVAELLAYMVQERIPQMILKPGYPVLFARKGKTFQVPPRFTIDGKPVNFTFSNYQMTEENCRGYIFNFLGQKHRNELLSAGAVEFDFTWQMVGEFHIRSEAQDDWTEATIDFISR